MFVGFLRTSRTPSMLAKLLAVTCKEQNIEFIYIIPQDICIKTDTVIGKSLIHGKWCPIETKIPKFIDVNPYFFNNKKYKKTLNYLSEKSNLSIYNGYIILKDELQYYLNKHNKLSSIAIPTYKLNSFDRLVELIDNYNIVVVKPVKGL